MQLRMFSYNPIAERCIEGVRGRLPLLSQENPDSGAPAGPDKGSLSSGGKTEVFQPTALHYRQSELSVGNSIQNRIPATAIQMTKLWRSNTDLL